MDTIQKHLETCIAKEVFPGATYVYGTSKQVLGHGALGKLAPQRGPVNENTLYDLASVTKPLVTMAFMKMFEEGLVCLDDTIADYLPEYKGYELGKSSLYQLLTHTSKISGSVQLYRSCQTKEAFLDAIRHLPPRDNVHTPVMYSSQGMIVLGEIMAAIEQKPLDQILKERLLTPLQMQHTMYNPSAELIENIASTEECPWRGGQMVTGQVHDENAVVLGGVCAHAGLFSTAADLAKVCQAMLTGLDAEGKRYYYPATIQLMTKNHTAGTNLARGLGWQCKDKTESPAGDLMSETSYGHTGFTGTSIWIDPERDLYAVLLTNAVCPKRGRGGMARARHIFHNLVVLEKERADEKQ